MPFLRVMSIILLLIVSTSFADVKIKQYDLNSAIKATSSSSGIQPSNVIATSESGDLQVLGFWFVNSGLTYSDDVVVMRVAFNNFLFDSSDGSVSVDDINLLSDIVPQLNGDPLFYPNPFRFSEGGTLQYILSTAMDIEIHMYDIFGRRIYKKVCAADSICGKSNINQITFNAEELNGYHLSAGVYFYIFIYEGEVIGRGKVAVVP